MAEEAGVFQEGLPAGLLFLTPTTLLPQSVRPVPVFTEVAPPTRPHSPPDVPDGSGADVLSLTPDPEIEGSQVVWTESETDEVSFIGTHFRPEAGSRGPLFRRTTITKPSHFGSRLSR